MPLTQEQARIADEALERVRSAERTARAAVESRSSVLTWITGSESAAAAGREELRQVEKIRATLEARRPGLEPAGLTGFVELASAGAEVSALVESARLVSGAGLVQEVVKPTLRELDPTNLSGPVGKVAVAAVAVLVVLLVLRVSR